MKKVVFILFLTVCAMHAKCQDAAQLLYDKGMEYFTLDKLVYNSGNLSLYLASRYFEMAANLGSEKAMKRVQRLHSQGYILTEVSYSPKLRQSAIDGNWRSMLDLAECLLFDFDVPEDYVSIYSIGNKNTDINQLFVKALNKMENDPDALAIEYESAYMLWYLFRLYKMDEIDEDFISDLHDFYKEDFMPAKIEYALLLLNSNYYKHNYKKGIKILEDSYNIYAYQMLAQLYRDGYHDIKLDKDNADFYLIMAKKIAED